MNFKDIEFAAIDFESSGFRDDGTDEPIQIGIAVMRNLEIDKDSFFRSFITPTENRPISNSWHTKHRISDSNLKGAPILMDLWPSIKESLRGRVVVAHGAGTEKRFLRTFPMHGFSPWIDTLHISRKLLPDTPDHALGSLIENLNAYDELKAFCPKLSWHDALFDAVACLILLKKLIEKIPGSTQRQEILQLF